MNTERTAEYWNEVWEKNKRPGYSNNTVDIINSILEGTVVDLGCGVTDFQNMIEANKNVTCYIGIDYSDNCVNRVNVSLTEKKMSAIKQDLETDQTLPFDDKTVDIVYASHILEHITLNSLYKLKDEIRRILKDDGIFIVNIPFADYKCKEHVLFFRTFGDFFTNFRDSFKLANLVSATDMCAFMIKRR